MGRPNMLMTTYIIFVTHNVVLTHFHHYWIVLVSFVERTLPLQHPLCVREMHSSYRTREQEYWEALIYHQSKEPKRLWTTFNSLLGRGRGGRASTDLPTFSAETFLERSTAKISLIRLSTADQPLPMFSSTEHRLHALQEISSTEFRRLILSSPPKSCELDSVPTFLLQEA